MSYGYGAGYDASSYGSTTAAARNYYNGTYGNQSGTSASAYRNRDHYRGSPWSLHGSPWDNYHGPWNNISYPYQK